jgi:hypothetical protein
MKRNKGGRPRGSIKNRESNAAIGHVCETFAAWGYQVEGELCDAIAAAASSCMGRTDPNGRQLSAERIEQIHKAHVSQQRKAGLHPFRRWMYTKGELVRERPAWANDSVTAALILMRQPALRLAPPYPRPVKSFWIRKSRKPSRYRPVPVEVPEHAGARR